MELCGGTTNSAKLGMERCFKERHFIHLGGLWKKLTEIVSVGDISKFFAIILP